MFNELFKNFPLDEVEVQKKPKGQNLPITNNSTNVKQSAANPERTVVANPATATQETKDYPHCSICLESEFWSDRLRSFVRCSICEPAPLKSLIGREWVFDDNGHPWEITQEKNYERFTKVK